MGFFDIFKKERSMLDELENITVQAFREIGSLNSIPPTIKTTNEDILRIYREISNSYKAVEHYRNEKIPAKYLNATILHFLHIHELQAQSFYEEHLEYEINKYINEGLRGYQKEDIELF